MGSFDLNGNAEGMSQTNLNASHVVSRKALVQISSRRPHTIKAIMRD
jgi:hypothetical protein